MFSESMDRNFRRFVEATSCAWKNLYEEKGTVQGR